MGHWGRARALSGPVLRADIGDGQRRHQRLLLWGLRHTLKGVKEAGT